MIPFQLFIVFLAVLLHHFTGNLVITKFFLAFHSCLRVTVVSFHLKQIVYLYMYFINIYYIFYINSHMYIKKKYYSLYLSTSLPFLVSCTSWRCFPSIISVHPEKLLEHFLWCGSAGSELYLPLSECL